jgi:type II secretory ATPase GspE/PulE/Tfp pilus assembly ATPase PilB-like protein
VDMGIDPMYVGTAVLVVCAQKLLRRICKDCTDAYMPSAEELKSAGLPPEFVEGGTFRIGKGCAVCNNTGFKGRVAIHEVLRVNAPIRKAIFEAKDLKSFKALCISEGMKTMRMVALDDWKRGLTTLEEVLTETAQDK